MGRLRVALCQLDVVVGDLGGNVAKILAALAEAEGAGADLAVFPELAITGYPPEDLLVSPAFVEGNRQALEAVAQKTGECAAVVGFVDNDGDLFNAAAVCAGGKVHGIWHKEILPNYGVFDEERWFRSGASAGSEDHLYEVNGVRVGVVVCEDAWSPTGPVARLGAGGAEVVLVLNASPYRAGVIEERRRMLATRAADASTVLVYANLVGGQDELVFDGGSMIFDHDGCLCASAPQFEETVFIVDLDLRPVFRTRLLDPRGLRGSPALPVLPVTDRRPEETSEKLLPTVAPELPEVEAVYRALLLATRDYVDKNAFSDVLVALSGGIDSSLVATIATDAIGPGRVHGVLLPSKYSSEGSVADALELAANLGIETRTIGIEPAHEAFTTMLEPVLTGGSGIAAENLQARIRGTVVMAMSNAFGWLVLTTGNKSEMAVGYATLYGDMNGGFAVIRDVPKLMVYELCRYRNAATGGPVVPLAVLEKPPSAELRPGQRDDDSLPPYDVLDPILQAYVELDWTPAEIIAQGFDPTVVRRVVNLVDRAEYKRRQAAPGPRVTSRGFGKDRRMPITNRFANE